jgi:hypothetical protein
MSTISTIGRAILTDFVGDACRMKWRKLRSWERHLMGTMLWALGMALCPVSGRLAEFLATMPVTLLTGAAFMFRLSSSCNRIAHTEAFHGVGEIAHEILRRNSPSVANSKPSSFAWPGCAGWRSSSVQNFGSVAGLFLASAVGGSKKTSSGQPGIVLAFPSPL